MMQGGKQEDTGSCRIADHDDCSFRGHLGDNNRATALFGSTFHRWLHSIHAALPDELSSARSMAKYSPLAAAIIAPTSTLLDIPALSQHWYTLHGETVPDPKACVVLSAVGLGLNVFANLLLVVRFSHSSRRNIAVVLSLVFWMAKTIVALVNLCVFAAWSRNGKGYSYDQGFWCAVLSLILAGLCSGCLLFHYIFAFGHPDGDREDLRMTGRKFMLSETLFIFLLGMQALAFNRLEHWTYVDAIYFSLQCALTIGYGDLPPQTAAGKVLVFPFAVLTISQLANEVSIIIEFIQNRAQDKRDRWRKRFSLAMHREAIKRKPYATLVDEMSLIHQIDLHQETMQQTYDLFWSGMSLATFWLVGAAVFNALEGWGYGVYAVMVLSLTIGFGDYTPETPAGRVVWIVYALMAVPVVTNFAVQTVTGIMYTWTEHRYIRARFELHREEDPEAFAPHAHFILKNHRKWDPFREAVLAEGGGHEDGESHDEHASGDDVPQKKRPVSGASTSEQSSDATLPNGRSLAPRGISSEFHLNQAENMMEADAELRGDDGQGSEGEGDGPDGNNGNDLPALPAAGPALNTLESKDDNTASPTTADAANPELLTNEDLAHLESRLLRELIDRVTKFEAQARQMLIDTMDRDLARTLLLADRNLQIRDSFHLYDGLSRRGSRLDGTGGDTADDDDVTRRANVVDSEAAAHDEDMVSRVRRYRNAFAEILVLSSTLLGLEGEDLKRFERWRVGKVPWDPSLPKKEMSRTRKHLHNAENWVLAKPRKAHKDHENTDHHGKHRRHKGKARAKARAAKEREDNELCEDMDDGDPDPGLGMGVTQGALPLPSALAAAYRARKMRHRDDDDDDDGGGDGQGAGQGGETAGEGSGNDQSPHEAPSTQEHPKKGHKGHGTAIKGKMLRNVGNRLIHSAEEEAQSARSLADWVVDMGNETLHLGRGKSEAQHAKARRFEIAARAKVAEEYCELSHHGHEHDAEHANEHDHDHEHTHNANERDHDHERAHEPAEGQGRATPKGHDSGPPQMAEHHDHPVDSPGDTSPRLHAAIPAQVGGEAVSKHQ